MLISTLLLLLLCGPLRAAPVLVPSPRAVTPADGAWAPGPTVGLHVEPGAPADLALPALKERLGRRGHALRPAGPRAPLRLAACPAPPEGYRLEVRPTGATLCAADPRGLLHAALTLDQLLAEGAAPAGAIADHPALPRRWLHAQLPSRTTAGEPELERARAEFPGVHADRRTPADHLPLLEQLGEAAISLKMNGLVIPLNGAFRFRSHPELALPGAAPLEALDPLLRRLRAHGVEPVPQLHLFSHQEKLLAPAWPDLLLVPMGRFPQKAGRRPGELFYWSPLYDPRNPRVAQIVDEITAEVMALFRGAHLHGGHDEAGALRFVQADHAALFAQSVGLARAAAARHGARLLIWADMLLNGHRLPGAAHGAEEAVRSWKAVEQIDRDVILVDWQYYPLAPRWPAAAVDGVPSARWLRAQGFDVLSATMGRPLSGAGETPKDTGFSQHAAAVLADLATPVAGEGGHTPGAGLGALSCHFSMPPGLFRPWPGLPHPAGVAAAAEQQWHAGARSLPLGGRAGPADPGED